MQDTERVMPAWLAVLDEEDLAFLRRFLLNSGSLKALADGYGISYPTVRARLDRLIAKVQAAEDASVNDEFERRLKIMVADGRLSPALARELLSSYQSAMKSKS